MLFSILMLSFVHGQSQQNDLNFKRISPDLGLSHQEVTSFYQDSIGYIWMATLGGVDRFDGYTFQSLDLQLPDGINPDGYTCIYKDAKDQLWVGTQNQGIILLDSENNFLKQYKHIADDSSSIANNWVEPIIEDSKGRIWIGTYGGGMHLYDAQTDEFVRYQNREKDPASLVGDYIYAIKEDQHGRLWVSTEKNGLCEFDPESRKVINSYRNDPNDPTSIGSDAVYDVVVDYQNRVWAISYRFGLSMLDRSTGSFINYGSNPDNPNSLVSNRLFKMIEEPGKGLWLGSQNAGLSYLDFETNNISNFPHDPNRSESLSSNGIRSLFKDHENNLWIGASNGPNIYHEYANQFVNYQHKPTDQNTIPTNSITAIFEDSKNQLWIGGEGQGLSKYLPEQNKFKHYKPNPEAPNSLSDGNITFIKESSDGKLLIGTWYGGLNIYNPKTGLFKSISQETPIIGLHNSWIFDLIEDHKNRYWLATPSGLVLIDLAQNKKTFFSNLEEADIHLNSRFIRNIYDDGNGYIWAFDSTQNNWFKINIETLAIEDLDLTLTPKGFEEESKTLWLSTNKGIASYNLDKQKLIEYGRTHGLPNVSINGISKDSYDNYWISTSNGLWQWKIEEISARQYNTSDGLVSNTLASKPYISKNSGRVYIYGERGVSSFHPTKLKSNPHPPALSIASLKYFDRKDENNIPIFIENIEEKAEIIFPHHYNILSLELAALSYNKSDKNQYQYQVEGLSNNWIHLGTERNLTLTNLDPKTYTLNFKGSNGDGVWNELGKSLKITITPPWYATWWAYLLYALSLIGLILAFIRWRTQADKQKLEEERKIVDRLKQVDKLKDQFLANTSHELRTPLNGIIGLSDSLIEGAAGELPQSVKKNLSMISSSGRRLSHLVNDILDFSKLKNQELNLRKQPIDMRAAVDIVLAMSDSMIRSKGLDVQNLIPEDLQLISADEDRVQQILFNLIGNAIKFTNEGGVTIRAVEKNNKIITTIKDTGIGIAKEKQEAVFTSFEQGDGDTARSYGGTGLGLSISRMLVNQHGGDISLESEIDKGTSVSFDLPLSEVDRDDYVPNNSTNTVISNIHSYPSNSDDTEEIAPESIMVPKGDQNLGHVLVVDDEEVNRQVLDNQLKVAGFTVTTVNDGFAAIEAINSTVKYDIVLLDIMMPRMSGYEVAKQIRETYLPSELPIIMLTAKNRIEDLLTGFKFGANDYLTKPFIQSELIARTSTHINLKNIHIATKQFVPDEFIRTIGRTDISDVELGDFAEKDVTVLFTDIRNYTSLSEQMTPEDNFEFVRSYVSKMGPIIEAHHGFINQYLGDGIMAIFARAPEDAINASIDMQRAIQTYNKQRAAQNRNVIRVGMGMMTGPLIMGIIGDQNRKDTTSISNTVNVAARLEGLTKQYGVQIIFSDETLNALTDPTAFKIRNLGHAEVKGKAKAIDVYECFDGDTTPLYEQKLAHLADYEDAIEAYMNNDFQKALDLFNLLHSDEIDDHAIDFFIQDCKNKITSPTLLPK